MQVPKGYDQALSMHGRGNASYLTDSDGNIVWAATAASHQKKASNDEILSQVKTPENLRAYVEQVTEPRGRDKWDCPLCGSGTGPKHTAAFSLQGDHWKCFSCGEGGDLLDLIGKVEGIEGYADRLHRAAELFGIDTAPARVPVTPATPPKVERKQPDYTIGREREKAYIEECKARIELAADYLRKRGWTVDEARTYGLGYDPARKRLVLPWPGSDYYHADRDVTGNAPNKYDYPKSDDVGERPIYNPKALEQPVIVVVEGPMDAMAVMRCGIGAVVALGGTYDANQKMTTALAEAHYQGCVVLMLDNDEPGRKGQAKLAKVLGDRGIACLPLTYADGCGYKDADELYRLDALQARTFFAETIDNATQTAEATDRHPNMTLHDPAEVAAHIYFEDDADEPIPTGFARLDRMIGGGLMRGLYVLGATSSFGKTTLSLQVADTIAAAGHPVLFVTIEQSAQEIVAKSISRLSHDNHNSHGGGLAAQEITTSTARKAWGPAKWEELATATNTYTEAIAPNLRILEGVSRPRVADVRAAAETMTAQYGTQPVIVLDYLQLLAPKSDRDSDKQAVDFNVTALRQFASALKTPVWCVATLNRDSYSGPVDLDSFKESGAIEYGADYLFGLQPRGIAAEVDSVKSAVEKKLKGNAFVSRAKREHPRKVELTVLKNRQGETTGTAEGLPFTYWPRTNYFAEG